MIAVSLAVAMALSSAVPAFADDKQSANQLVEKARFTMDSFMSDPLMGPFRDLIKDAKGVFIIPQMLRGAFVIGAYGGSGVFLARDENTREWIGPAFYTVGGASFGFQIGGEASETVLLAMTDRGVRSLLANSFKLGADAGLALGPVGAGVSAATANLSADILSFSRSKGLYGGISLEGAVVATRPDWNEAYYGKEVTPADIFVRHEVTNPHAAELIDAVTRSACIDPASGKC
jgi:lipid-binding SYLF domain-containing protein